MLLCAQYILPITSEPFQKGAVLVRDNVIRDIGTAEMLKLRYPDEEVVDFGQAAIMPGLVDLHTHLENSVMRGIVHDVPYTTWVTSMLEKSAKMDVSDWYDSAILGGLEALSSGITCVADITATGAACTATQKLGMRSVIYREVGAMDKRRVDYAMRIAENDIMHWREEVDGDRITIGVAPAAMYACHPSMFSKVSEFARRENVPVAMHVAGNREEYNFIKYGSSPFSVHTMDQKRGFVEIPPWLPTGTTPVRYALNWGAFESDNVLAIHCVHVDDKDVQKLKEYDVAVAVCPRCNAQLGMGVAPINEFMRAGLRLGMGTDSPAATDSTDMLTEMRIGMLVQRAVNVGEFLDSATMLEMVSRSILPASYRYLAEVAKAERLTEQCSCACASAKAAVEKLCVSIDVAAGAAEALRRTLDAIDCAELNEGERAGRCREMAHREMAALRRAVDALEMQLPQNFWPVPDYSALLYDL